jgi:glycosyltransferase involved in cell wall biosynthesis
MRILHITSHLGGGIGKFLSGLVEQAKIAHPETEHQIVCLEKPEKDEFLDKIRKTGTKVTIQPIITELSCLIRHSDISQLEFWNHPLLIQYLCKTEIPEIRLLTICHNNGFFNPKIPTDLILKSHKYISTTRCRYTPYGFTLNNCVFSSGGFKDFPVINRIVDEELSVGYFGSTVFSKMHPGYAHFINEANVKVKVIGDLHNKEILEKQTDKLEFLGFVPNVVEELKKINVLAYILNPNHYGTTENALLEAMSMGLVPIVLNNHSEQCFVFDNITGFVVHNEKEFAERIEYLRKNPKQRVRIGNTASKFVRKYLSVEKTESQLNQHYQSVVMMDKKVIDFKKIFGYSPSELFLSCQRDKSIFQSDGNINLKNVDKYSLPMLYEETKGSVFHFAKYFPENKELKMWAENLRLLQ